MMNHNAHTLPTVVVVVQLQHLDSPSWTDNYDLPLQFTSQDHGLQILVLNPKWYSTLLSNLLHQNWVMNNEHQMTSWFWSVKSQIVNGPYTMHIANKNIES